MPLTMSAQVGYNDVLGAPLRRRISAFETVVKSAARQGASVAQAESRSHLGRTRPEAPKRKGRDDESIASVLKWSPTKTGNVGINLSELNSKSPHWLIQEIGTNARAVQRVMGRTNPTGRPTTDATYIRTVRPQVGRRIRSSLVWATGPGGTYVRAGAGESQQLYLRKQIQGVPRTSTRSQPGIIIRREIKPRHFVQQGGQAGFRMYRGSVLAAARSQFKRVR